jgi:hypothetical protein
MSTRCLNTLSLLLSVALLCGCSTYADRLREIRSSFYAGNVETASIELNKDVAGHPREAEPLKMDRAVVELAAGRPKEAVKLLREVRDKMDYNSQTSVVEKVGSILTDDTHTAYAGEDYEKILVRAFLALSDLMCGGSDAKAYSLQVSALQEQIIAAGADSSGQNVKLSYKRIALGAYLDGMLQEANHMDYNDAARSWAKVCSWEPDFPFGRFDCDRALHGHHSERGNGVLYVFTLVGRGPYKVETVEPASTISMFLATAVLSQAARHSLPPSVAPIKVPKVISYPNSMNNVLVEVDQRAVGATATITDVGQLAVQQYKAIYPQVVVRAVLRRAAKEAILYGAEQGIKSGVGSHGTAAALTEVGGFLAGLAWEGSESADTRCWGMLPDRIQVLRVEIPAGLHRITLRANGGFAPLTEGSQNVQIDDARNTYMLANFTDGHLIGKILVSDRDNSSAPPVHLAQTPGPRG